MLKHYAIKLTDNGYAEILETCLENAKHIAAREFGARVISVEELEDDMD